jgi:protein-disulfide isomerase
MSKRNKAAERAARAAALRAEQERKARQEKQRRLLTFGGIAFVLVAIVVVAVWFQARGGKIDETAAVPQGATDAYGLLLGETGADHEVVVYEDFICPSCKSFKDRSGADLEAAVDEGRATVEYRPLNFLARFGDYSERSANAFAVVLDTAGPEVAEKFHDILFAEQPPEDGEHPDDAWLIEKAVEAGASESEVTAGIERLEFEGWVANATKQATKDGVRGTPTVLVDGESIDIGDPAALVDALQ